MSIDWLLTVAAFGIGIVVGLTGMGGGALMTPVLVLFFQVPPLTAVSSDLVASAIMKPVGSVVHLRRGTVHLGLVKWLCLGSIPGAFSGVLIARALGRGQKSRTSSASRSAWPWCWRRPGSRSAPTSAWWSTRAAATGGRRRCPRGRRRWTSEVGRPSCWVWLAGIVVGMTSVGSGSLIIIALMGLYPTLKASELVGTDLVQAVPLVASAAIGHLLFGDFHLDLTTSLLLGCIPGVWVGAHLSARAPGGLVRRALAFVLLASALKLLNVSTPHTGIILVLVLLIAPVLWMMVRRHHGFPAIARRQRQPAPSQ